MYRASFPMKFLHLRGVALAIAPGLWDAPDIAPAPIAFCSLRNSTTSSDLPVAFGLCANDFVF
jgi:hypothetical protein